MDKIYFLSYPLIFAVLVQAIMSLNHVFQGCAGKVARDSDDIALHQIRRVDRKVMAILGFILGSGTTLLTTAALR